MFGSLKRKAARTARKTAISLAALVAMLIGLGFLTVAAWILIADAHDALVAATILGLCYLSVSGILLLSALSGDRSDEDADTTPATPAAGPTGPDRESGLSPLAEAFAYGLDAGIKAKRRRRSS